MRRRARTDDASLELGDNGTPVCSAERWVANSVRTRSSKSVSLRRSMLMLISTLAATSMLSRAASDFEAIDRGLAVGRCPRRPAVETEHQCWGQLTDIGQVGGAIPAVSVIPGNPECCACLAEQLGQRLTATQCRFNRLVTNLDACPGLERCATVRNPSPVPRPPAPSLHQNRGRETSLRRARGCWRSSWARR